VSQCHAMSWNTNLDIVKQMWDTGHFSFIAYSISEALGTAQLFLDFRKRTYTSALKTQMESLGCTEVSVTVFGNDGGKLAGSALFSVQKAGEREQHVYGTFGECKSAVMKAAQDKRKEDEQRAKEDRAEEAVKTAAAVKASLGDLNAKQEMLVEGQASLHNDVQGLRSDSVDAMRDLEKRFKEVQQALLQTQKALKTSQRAEAETSKHLTEEQGKNHRQAVMLAKLNAQIKETDGTVGTLQKANSKLETENAKLKVKLSNLTTMQTMQDDVRFLRTNMSLISEHISAKFDAQDAKFKTQDEKQDDILRQGADIMAAAKRIETMHDVAFSGGEASCSSGEECDDEGSNNRKRRRAEEEDLDLDAE
jgi:chromosome segregation ATPase